MKLSSFNEQFVTKYKIWLRAASPADLSGEKVKLEARMGVGFGKHWQDADEEALSYVLEEMKAREANPQKIN